MNVEGVMRMTKKDNAAHATHVFIRAEIIGELPSGQKMVRLLANNADGIVFYTDDKSIVRISPTPDRRLCADAADIVQCKDCKWFAENNNGLWYGCWLFNSILANSSDAPCVDDFCSKGERKKS